ncbi:hypothetical protein SAMN05192566_0270 [Methylophilus rhizosphaerae]|uniref:Uncharacterized protein n=2 Tax=Methylophilus rhizosphaerae TaxID=492660 RepID=A0A1G8ZES2_9PROT|nr:hypothetical protein SAMN05192566_0270 [Methylophilus rhizosphaerae]
MPAPMSASAKKFPAPAGGSQQVQGQDRITSLFGKRITDNSGGKTIIIIVMLTPA